MKTNRLSRSLRWTSLAVLLLGFAVWTAYGARVGWTQTSMVTLQHDEITGIEYPVRHSVFRPGIEVPLLATLTAAAFAAMSWSAHRRAVAKV